MIWLALLLIWLHSLIVASASVEADAGDDVSSHTQAQLAKTFQHRHAFYHKASKDDRNHTQLFQISNISKAIANEDQPRQSLDFELQAFSLATFDASESQIIFQVEEGHHVLEPNISDKETVVNLAKMTSDAYLEDPNQPNWFNTSLGFNFTNRFGWDQDGLRGHIFTSEDNSMVVVSFKGTTIYPRGKLSERDRVNDVTMFSCCCGAQHPYYYAPVCNCSTAAYECNSNCLTQASLQNDSYYDAAIYTMEQAFAAYPKSKFWVVGHSLGGAIAALIGLTYDIPAIAFEAPPERLPAERMGLIPVNGTAHYRKHHAYHIGNSADPVYMGSCQGYLSFCSAAGFSFETLCHTGKRCEYDTVRDKGWHVNIGNHRIDYVIANVLEVYDEVPECEAVEECFDCFRWKFT